MIDALTSYGTLFSGRRKPSRLTNASAEQELLAAINGSRDVRVTVSERWYRGLGGMVVGERKIGDGPWEKISDVVLYDRVPYVQMDTNEYQAIRAIFENGYADNTIILQRTGPYGGLSILCGHCHKITFAGGHWCCDWMHRMYDRYLTRQLMSFPKDRSD
jgi:hypothetical protein